MLLRLLLILAFLWAVKKLAEKFSSIPILNYHFIEGKGEKAGLSISFQAFEKQLLHLLKRNCRVISPQDLLECRKNQTELPSKSVIITFDDGDENFYTMVYPVLVRYQIPVTMFIITDWIGKPGYLTWEQIHSMTPRLITIGSHTVSHRYLPDLPFEEIRRELTESKKILQEKLNRNIRFFCYPVGGFNASIREMVKEAGYEAAFTTNRGRNFRQKDLFALKRVKMTEDSVKPIAITAKLSGYYQIFNDLFPKEPGGSEIKPVIAAMSSVPER